MLTYTALFVLSLVLSAIIYFLYRVITDSSKSIYRSKKQIAKTRGSKVHSKTTTKATGLAYKPAPFGQDGHASPKNIARTNPALPTDTINWGWQGSGVQLHEPFSRPSSGAGESNHCSLYDVNTPATSHQHGQFDGRLKREEKLKPAGRTYKVTRREYFDAPEPESEGKPWGW